ncbi:GNAT family N-acetyltransferase [Streptomyces sp. 147326]|uniref:GNAT family N-acetyltransferase n=1 Tax=Streptomyces sp. 147326 TaxID=3074379 RepID=UPI0038576277
MGFGAGPDRGGRAHGETELPDVPPLPEGYSIRAQHDEANATGAFEPVGTRPDHRRQGLALAVCTAVLHAFARAGGRRAIVNARGDAAYPVPKRLYESMGFTTYARTHTFVGRPTD